MRAPDPNHEFTAKGWWWPADSTERSARPGTVTITPGGLATVLIDQDFERPAERFPVLFGWRNDDAAPMTLYRCLAGNEHGVNDNRGREYTARYALFGSHWPATHFDEIQSARIWLDGANEWFGETIPWSTDASEAGVLDSFVGVREEVDFSGGLARLELTPTRERMEQEYRIGFRTEFGWYPREIAEIDDVEQWLHDFQLFLMLCRGRFPSARSILLKTQTSPEQARLILGSPWYGKLEPKPLWRHQLLLPYRDVQQRFGEIFSHIIGLIREKRSAFNRFRSVLSDRSLLMEENFFERVRFVDSVLDTPGYVDKPEFTRIARQIKAAIPDDTPEALAESLRTAITCANRLSFRERLETTVDSFPEEVREEYGLDEDFIGVVVRTRNELAHGAALKRSSNEVIPASERLLLLIGLYVLSLAGVPLADISDRIQHSQYARLSDSIVSF